MVNLYISLINGLGDKLLDMIGFYVICKYLNYVPNVQFNKKIQTFAWGNNEYDPNLFIFDGIILANNDININAKIIINKKVIRKNNYLYINSPIPSGSLSPFKVHEYLKQYIPTITIEEISNKFTESAKNIIKPSEIILSKIPLNIENSYGIHLRKTDKVHTNNYDVTHENRTDEFNIIINKLLEDINDICKNEHNPSFLIVSEDIEWKNEIINKIKINNNVNIIQVDYDTNNNFTNNNLTSVLDMFCLSKCKKIYQGVKYSTFSIVASILGNGKLVNYSKYLEDNDKCMIHYWNSVIEINNSINYNIINNINIPNIVTNLKGINMIKTLVIILDNTNDLTFDNFNTNVITPLNADLCICNNITKDNPFYNLAKYKFIHNFSNIEDAYDYAYDIITKKSPKYEKLENINGLYSKVKKIKQSVDNITYYGSTDDINNIDELLSNSLDDIIIQISNVNDINWNNQIYGSNDNTIINFESQNNVITYKKPLKWREFLKIKNPIISDFTIFNKWFLLKNLMENDLINTYDRFIITQSNLIYNKPHIQLNRLNDNLIYNFSDMHVIVSKNNIEVYLNILNNIVNKSNQYFMNLEKKDDWDMEKLTKYHLEQNNVLHLTKDFIFDIDNTQVTSIRKNYDIVTPTKLSLLDKSILDEFNIDFNHWIDINCFNNGLEENSYDQVPDVCKDYMNYINNNWELKWSNELIEELLRCCNNEEYDKLSPNDYPNASLQFVEAFKKYANPSGKKCLVLGSISPWIESLLIHFNAGSVTTLDYVQFECNHDKIKILNMQEYKKDMKFDLIVSFSSLEHDGLGRYGDPINPNGDIDACIEVYNMLNPNGYFLCGIPIGEGCIEGNLHRIYNKKRLNKLFSLFNKYIGCVSYHTHDDVLDFTGNNWQNQPIFIYSFLSQS